MIDWNDIRSEFPGLDDRVFLDAACVSLLPKCAEQAVQEFATDLARPFRRDATEHHIWMDTQKEETVPTVSSLLGVSSNNVALVESTTHGLNIAAQTIPLESGDEILMCDLEFLQVAIPFVKLADFKDLRTVFVEHEAGVADVNAFAKLLTPKTKAIVISSTQWSSGYRVDLPGLADLCRSVNAWLIVDGIQQAGAVPFELDGVDFLITGGHKWLNAPMGTGFMYVSDRVLNELEPRSWGYLALETPEGGWGEYFTTPSITPDRDYKLVDSAKQFEIGGTGNYPGALALNKSVELVNSIGIDAAADRIWTLGERLIDGLRGLNVHLETSFDRDHRAGIISFTLGSRDRDAACVNFLLDRRIWVGQRYTSNSGGVRVSVHYFNTEDDIDQLLESTTAFLNDT